MNRQINRLSAAAWAGRLITGIVVTLLLLDAAGKIAEVAPVVEGTARLGYPPRLVFMIGIVELLCVAAYVVPRSSIAGAVLLTGYLGGAVATHVRVEDPFWTHALAPVYMAVFVWAGLVLRDSRLRVLIPARRTQAIA